jgi:hypothetical protein
VQEASKGEQMYCSSCGTEADTGTALWSKCGTVLVKQEAGPGNTRLWSIVAYAALFISPLLSFGYLDPILGNFPIFDNTVLRLTGTDKLVLYAAIAAFIGWAFWIAGQLSKKKPASLARLRVFLVFNFALLCFCALAAGLEDILDQLALRLLFHGVGLVISFFYFKKSKNVRAIFGTNI